MNSREVNIIEFPSNFGLKKADWESEPGVKNLPHWLKSFGFHEQIRPKQIYKVLPPAYSTDMDEKSGVRNSDKIAQYAISQNKLLTERLKENTFQLIIGGDCSILIGVALALKQKGNYGLFFLDGHTDFIYPELSQTGAVAGMDLAIVTGYGHNKLTNIQDRKPYFQEEHVYCVGNREYDKDYVQPVLKSNIHYFDLKKLREHGLENTSHQFLELVEETDLDGFFIHIDVDVLHDDIMPAVDSREKDGLTYPEFAQLLKPLFSSKKAVGAEITILDPNLDKSGIYTAKFVKNFLAIFEHGRVHS